MAPLPTSAPGTYWFAMGLLAGILLCSFGPTWLRWTVCTADLIALGWSASILNYTDTGAGRWVLVAAEFRARLGNVRKIGRWLLPGQPVARRTVAPGHWTAHHIPIRLERSLSDP